MREASAQGACITSCIVLAHTGSFTAILPASIVVVKTTGSAVDAGNVAAAARKPAQAATARLIAASARTACFLKELERVQALENYTRVTAPLDGVVIWRYADTGALIQGGTESNQQALPIVRLSQSALLRLRFPVPEEDVKYVHEGDRLDVRVDAIGRSFSGKIVRFTRNVSFETRTMETEVDVENKDLSIAPGMYANLPWPWAWRRAANSTLRWRAP